MSVETYLIPSLRVNRRQLEFLNELITRHGLSDREIRAFQQVFAYGICIAEDAGDYCPLSRDFRRNHLEGEDLLRLCDPERGLLDFRAHDHFRHRCRLYRIKPWIMVKFWSLMPLDDTVVDWIRGKTSPQPLMTSTYTSTRKSLPPLVRDAVRVHNRIPKLFDAGSVNRAIDGLECGPHSSTFGAQRAKIRADRGRRFLHNVRLQVVGLNAVPPDLHDLIAKFGFTAYLPHYSVKSSGRLYETHGGTQNLPRELKSAAFEHADLRNYDIRACHPSILRQLFEEYNRAKVGPPLDASWLTNYLDNPKRRAALADQVGVSNSCWKRCVLALFYGAAIKIRGEQSAIRWCMVQAGALELHCYASVDAKAINPSYSVFDAIWDDLSDGFPCHKERYHATVERVRRFRDALEGFDRVMRDFAAFLASPRMGALNFSPLFRFNRKASKLTNLCGMKMDLPRKPDGKLDGLLGKHLLCHILQGAEAGYIHRIVAIHGNYNYLPLGNEHDGVITFGVIPEDAKQRVCTELGLKYIQLEEKPLG